VVVGELEDGPLELEERLWVVWEEQYRFRSLLEEE
jgi:hypothetical protein